jgi:hypothetical protein
MSGKPNIYVIDGRGIIRRIFVGAVTRTREAQIGKLVEFLRKEHDLTHLPSETSYRAAIQ